MNWFNNIKLSVKMSLTGLILVIGIALPTYLYLNLINQSLAAAKMELAGIEPINNVVQLKKELAKHRGISARFLSGDDSLSALANEQAKEVVKVIGEFKQRNFSPADSGTIASTIEEIDDGFEKLARQVQSNSITGSESFDRHSSIIQKNDAIISNFFQIYGLSFDPEPASHYIIDGNLRNLPRLTESLGKIRGLGASLLTKGEASESEKTKLLALLKEAYFPRTDFVTNLSPLVKLDKSLAYIYNDAKSFSDEIIRFENVVVNEILEANTLTYSASRFFDDYTQLINRIYVFFDSTNLELEKILSARISDIAAKRTTVTSTIAVLLILAGLLGYLLLNSIVISVKSLIDSAKGIANGEFEQDFEVTRKDELGLLSASLSDMNSQLKQAAVVAEESLKIRQALDNTSTCFMMADKKRNIIYTNRAVVKMLKEAEADIQKDLPQFSADNLLQSNIDQFHKNPSHQMNLLASLNDTYHAEISIGGRQFGLIANPINNSKGESVGTSVEWLDKTEMMRKERDTKRILESLNTTTTNVMIADAERKIIYMNRSVEMMLRESEAELRKELPHFSVDTIIGSNIDIFHKNPAHQKDLLAKLKTTYTAQITVGTRHFRLIANPIFLENGERLGSVVEWSDRTLEIQAEEDISRLVDAAVRGDFSERAQTEGKAGFMLNIAESLNRLIDITESGLSDVARVLQTISNGDLTQQIDKEYLGTFDDLKNYTNQTSSYLGEMIGEIREAADTINGASSEIAQGNSDLSSRTEEQASSLEETASSMEELTGTVRLNAENANQANGLASKASGVAVEGGKLIGQVVETMASINESAQKISDIIGVIDGIAFQTNILALNAAVEAARAGEQGRGFAVVASEVRTLAQRSANAAKDIKGLISDSVSKIDSGNTLVNRSGETMQEIVTAIKRVNDIMSEIAAASAEQASGIDEVGKAITQMDEVTQQNAALVEEAAAAAESMQSQAEQLSTRVSTFKINENDIQQTAKLEPPKPKRNQRNTDKPSIKRIVKPSDPDEDEWESF